MSKIIDAIKGLENLSSLEPATLKEIEKAEHELELVFADDFREYVQNYGAISAKGIELIGITVAKRLDVVSVTKAEREMSNIPPAMYVIENIGIDGILILQDSSGKVYSIRPGVKSCVSENRQNQEEVRWEARRRRAVSLGRLGSRRAGRYARRRCECRSVCRDILQPGISRQHGRRT